MAIPADWSIVVTRQDRQYGQIQGVSDIRAVCPHCQVSTTFAIKSQVFNPQHTLTDVHLVVQCNYAACRKLSYLLTSLFETMLTNLPNDLFFMYPVAAIQPSHPSIPSQIADDWLEAQKAMQASIPKAAAVMFRRVLYSVLMDKGCKLYKLKDGLNQLIKEQRLPAIFDEWLPAITDDGHDGAHPDRALHVSAENVAETFEYTSELLRYLYIEPYDFQQRRTRNNAPSTP